MDTSMLTLLFQDKTAIESLAGINLDGVQLGMTPFQLEHFVLNRREFPTDFARFQQAKLELYHRIQILFDLHYQYRKAEAEIKLAEGEIERLQEEALGKTREAKIELQQIEKAKNEFQLTHIRQQALDRLKEALVFKEVYEAHRQFDEMNPKEMAELEEESWKIKSAYYPELQERYGLTPCGFIQLPHETGGLEALMKERQSLIGRESGLPARLPVKRK